MPKGNNCREDPSALCSSSPTARRTSAENVAVPLSYVGSDNSRDFCRWHLVEKGDANEVKASDRMQSTATQLSLGSQR